MLAIVYDPNAAACSPSITMVIIYCLKLHETFYHAPQDLCCLTNSVKVIYSPINKPGKMLLPIIGLYQTHVSCSKLDLEEEYFVGHWSLA